MCVKALMVLFIVYLKALTDIFMWVGLIKMKWIFIEIDIEVQECTNFDALMNRFEDFIFLRL